MLNNQSVGMDEYELGEIYVETNRDERTENDYTDFSKSFSTLDNALNYINSSTARSDLSETKNVLLICLRTEENFGPFNSNELQEFRNMFIKKSIVLLISSISCESFMLFWKSKEIDYFLVFKPPQKKTAFEIKELYGFITSCLVEFLSNNHLGILQNCITSKDSNEIDLTQIENEESFNILKLCAQYGDIKCVEILLNLNIFKDDINDTFNPQSTAQYSKLYDVLLLLLQNNYTYPTNVFKDQFPDYLNNFVADCENIHKGVTIKNLDLIKEIIDRNPKLNYFYNTKNESVLKIALISKQFSIYEELLARGIILGPHEAIENILKAFSDNELTILREIHFRCSKDLPEKHMDVLMTNTSISHDDIEKEDREKFVRRAYNVLNKDPQINPILKIVAASKRFTIVFDFKRLSVNTVDPTSSEDMRGVFYLDRKICIGARQLLDSSTEHETFGTLAHELCHYAIYLTYRNRAKPYLKSDQKTKEEYKKIIQHCKDHREQEEIIDLVFNYDTNMHSAELIVRVVHLLAKYHNQLEKIRMLKEVYSSLFNYHSDVVIPAINKAVPEIRAKADKEIKEKDKKISYLIILLFISIGLGIIIACFIKWYLQVSIYDFNDLSESQKNTVRNGFVLYKNVTVKLNELFPGNSDIFVNLTSDHISQILDNKVLNFDDPQLHYLDRKIDLKWENLTGKLKEKFLGTYLNFQGEIVEFKDLFEKCPKAFDALTSQQIVDVLSGKEMKIGKKFKSQVKFFIERKFIRKYYDYENNLLHKNSTETIEQAEKDKIFILSSKAGAGKTVTFEQLTMEIKSKFPSRWVSYLDLPKQTTFYKSNKTAENFLKKILELNLETNKFEVKIFEESFKSGNLVLIWNAFDEISPTHNEFVLNVFKSIHENSTNVQLVCTRPLYPDYLSEAFKVKPWQLLPFDKEKKQEFLREFFKSENVSSEKVQENVKNVEIIVKKLQYYKNKDEYNFETPLMLRLIAEIHENEELFESANIYKIFEAFVKKKIKIWLKKSENSLDIASKLLSIGSLNIILQKFAILNEINLFSFPMLHLKLRKLQIMKKDFTKDFPIEEISRMGILFINGKKFEFSHKTLAEFFVAQFFIENVFDVDGSVDNDEAELRLELFFVLTRTYGSIQQIVTDFMMSYLQKRPQEPKKFNPTISNLLRTKFKNFFFRMLIVRNTTVFEFLFEFFKPEHDLLVDLLHVNEPETFYTAIFNPSPFVTHINPEKIKRLAQSENCLNDMEVKQFLSGKNQKGKIVFGAQYDYLSDNAFKSDKILYPNISFIKSHDTYGSEIETLTGTSLWDLYPKVKEMLNIQEQKELFPLILTYKIYNFYDEKFITTNYSEYEKLYTNFENLLTKNEIKDALGDALELYVGIFPHVEYFKKNINFKFLNFLLKKAEKCLEKSQIFEIFLTKNILHSATYEIKHLKILWEFLCKHTNKKERKQILLQESHTNLSPYYDFTPFKILHRAMATPTETFDLITEIYKQHFKTSKIQEIISSLNDFLYYAIGRAKYIPFENFSLFLADIFKGNETLLIKLLERKVEPTNLSVFEFVEDFRELPYFKRRWFDNLETLYNLLNSTKEILNNTNSC